MINLFVKASSSFYFAVARRRGNKTDGNQHPHSIVFSLNKGLSF